MARDGLFALLCAGVVALGNAAGPALSAPGEDRDGVVAAALAVQTAMQEGRAFLQRGDHKAAVRVLEQQLPKINGNPAYLTLLRDAYRGYIKDLRVDRQEAEAQRYLQRLQILDPGAPLDSANGNSASTANLTPPPAPPAPAPAATPPKPATEVRAVRGEDEGDDPFQEPKKRARSLLSRAEEAFAARHYREAGTLFEQAQQIDAGTVAPSRERWAYCILERVADQMNQAPDGGLSWTDLEKDVRRALEMTPSNNARLQDFGTRVLAELDKRRGGDGPAVTVTHYERNADGWARAETANFRIFHNQSREFAEQVAQTAERTRTTMARKWFGGFKDNWNPRCDIYLHATAQDYSKATGVPLGSPGHSSFKTDGSRMLSRQIDLHCDEPRNLLGAVLPHETTHVVLAGQFGDQPIPRWADEGIAVLTEPRDKIDRHLRNLVRCRQETGLFSTRQLMQMADYPEPRYITVFYAESVSLVEFLATRQQGPETLTKFLRAAQKDGYEAALKQYYGYKNFDDLQQEWHAKAFAAAASPPAVASGGR
jgi:tetratricopeptide (TPR) repeat protein